MAKMRLSGLIAGAVALLAVSGQVARATPCVRNYAISFSITSQGFPNPSANVSGSVCTDGTIGAIGSANIVSWDLTLSNSFNPSVSDFSISSANGGALAVYQNVATDPLSATATHLTWNYADPGAGNYVNFVFYGPNQPLVGYYYIGLFNDNTINTFAPGYALSAVSGSYGQTSLGSVVIGQSVPEPASLTLLCAGLFGVATVRRRQKA